MELATFACRAIVWRDICIQAAFVSSLPVLPTSAAHVRFLPLSLSVRCDERL